MRLLRETSYPSLRWRLTMDALFVASVLGVAGMWIWGR